MVTGTPSNLNIAYDTKYQLMYVWQEFSTGPAICATNNHNYPSDLVNKATV